MGVIIASMMLLSAMTTPNALSAPVPEHLTSACQVKTVKASNGPYYYDTYEHCKKPKA